jgi:plasmid stability protein
MATLYVREIPDAVYQNAQKIASAHGRSLSAYVLTVLEQAIQDENARHGRSKALASIRRRRSALPKSAPDSVAMMRQIRGEDE